MLTMNPKFYDQVIDKIWIVFNNNNTNTNITHLFIGLVVLIYKSSIHIISNRTIFILTRTFRNKRLVTLPLREIFN